MIAMDKCRSYDVPTWHQKFLTMLPDIKKCARYAFRRLPAEARDEAVTEVVASAFVAFARLVELGKSELAHASVLARHAVAQFRDGRRVGRSRSVAEVLSSYSQKKKKFRVRSLDRPDGEDASWVDAVTSDTRRMPVDETVCFRLDFAEWLGQLTRRNRRVAEHLAVGNRAIDAARKFKLSAARVSQVRNELAASWAAFRSEDIGVRLLDPVVA